MATTETKTRNNKKQKHSIENRFIDEELNKEQCEMKDAEDVQFFFKL